MVVSVQTVVDHAGRQAGDLTRRDVVRALLTVPSEEAVAALPGLRRALIAAGNSFSPAFWESTEETLRLVSSGTATVGDVQMWLESTGTEPSTIVGMHVWDPESERTPLAEELHGLLVAHLEEQVRTGKIDPDRLAASDREALREYVAYQDRWLQGPLPDGRVPGEVLLDEQDEGLVAAWDAADAAAAHELEAILAEVGPRPCPNGALHAVCDELRAALRVGAPPFDLLASCGGVDPDDVAEDRELWLILAEGTVNPVNEPPEAYSAETMASWYALQHVDWLGAVSELARRGPGTLADAYALAAYVEESEDVDGGYEDPDDRMVVADGFDTVVELWRSLGAVDDRQRLTELGWWGLPEALWRVWTPTGA